MEQQSAIGCDLILTNGILSFVDLHSKYEFVTFVSWGSSFLDSLSSMCVSVIGGWYCESYGEIKKFCLVVKAEVAYDFNVGWYRFWV